MNTQEYIARRIKSLRRSAGMSQAELGAKLEPPCAANTISSYESARTAPNPEAMTQICAALHVGIAELYPPTEAEDEAERIVALFQSMPADRRQIALDILAVLAK